VPGNDWSPPLDPYLNAGPTLTATAKSKVFDCPANPAERDVNGWAGNDHMPYIFNMNMTSPTMPVRHLTNIKRPDEAFFILERSTNLSTPIGGLSTTWYAYAYCGLTDDIGRPTPNLTPHRRTTNVGFGDAHVEARPWNDYALIFFTSFPGYTERVIHILESNYWARPWPGN
jgi:prepilin-type processing-associated H-X9-DG protein